MKFTLVAVALVGTVLAVEASYYNQRGSYPQASQAIVHHNGAGAGCGGYGCHGNGLSGSGSNYQGAGRSHGGNLGPYHSYAVKPAIYGGHGMYQYRGYARHHSAPAAHYRAVRSYNSGLSASHYGLRPVQALVLAPVSGASYGSGSYGSGLHAARGASGYGQSSARYTRSHRGGASAYNRRQPVGNHLAGGAYGGRHLGAGNNGLGYNGYRQVINRHRGGYSRGHAGNGGY